MSVWPCSAPFFAADRPPESDADVLVRFAAGEKGYDRLLALAELLEEALGRPVELVTTEALSPVIGPRLMAEARDVFRAC